MTKYPHYAQLLTDQVVQPCHHTTHHRPFPDTCRGPILSAVVTNKNRAQYMFPWLDSFASVQKTWHVYYEATLSTVFEELATKLQAHFEISESEMIKLADAHRRDDTLYTGRSES